MEYEKDVKWITIPITTRREPKTTNISLRNPNAVASFKKKIKAPGSYDILAEVLRTANQELIRVLHRICNKWKTRH